MCTSGGRDHCGASTGSRRSSFALGDLEVQAIWGSGPADVWAAGRHSRIAHFDGQRWTLQYHPASEVEALAGSGPQVVWAWGLDGMFRFDGRAWQGAGEARPQGTYFKAAAGPGRAGGPVALVGQNGGAAFWKGERWTTLRPADHLGSGGGFFWVDTQGQRWLLSAAAETRRHGPAGWVRDSHLFEGVDLGGYPKFWARDSHELWAWGSKGPARRMDGRWQSWDMGAESLAVSDISGGGQRPGGAEATGEGGGGVWVLGGAASGPARQPPILAIWDGKSWQRQTAPRPSLIATGGTGVDDIWLVGDGIVHWNGQRFQEHVSAGAGRLASACSNGRTDAWAVGERGSAFHWDGRAWSARPTGTSADLLTVWCGGSGDVWAAGVRGTVVSWNGTAWRETPTPTTNPIFHLRGTPSGLWASGWGGIILGWR